MYKILIAMMLVFTVNAQATDVFTELAVKNFKSASDTNLNWTVGDTANFDVTMMQFLKGTLKMSVASATDRGFWINQDIDMMGQKQLAEAHIDKNTGEIIEMRVNGEKKDPPAAGEQEIVETKEATITVPAGTYNTIYIKIRDKESNKETQVWMNRKEIPIMGQAKMIAPAQMGEVNMELTSFTWAN